MQSRIFIKPLLLLSLSFLLIISCSRKQSESITIACAANVQYALEELCQAFEEEYNLKTRIVIGSSGKLTAQIKEGAPYDIFISADMKYPIEVFKSGIAYSEPEVYAFGKLVLVSIDPHIKANFNILTSEKIKHIAVANAKTAPYGIAAESVLRYYGVYDELKHKLVYGESISQTNQFISTGAAEIGFTSTSSMLAYNNQNLSFYGDFEKDSYPPIAQGAVMIKNPRKDSESAKKFYLFLFSTKGAEILLKYGYELPNKQGK